MSTIQFPHIESKRIFPIAVDNRYLVYAPLANACFSADPEDIIKLEDLLRRGCDLPFGYEEILALINESDEFTFNDVSPYALTGMSILPTWNCNFNCSYCYAAKAHKKKDIDLPVAYKAIEFFFDKMGNDDVAIQILGGGEPFTRWEIVKNISSFARQCELKYNRKLTLSIATNGSLLNDEMIADIIKYDLRLSFSFDVLEDIQNKQRAAYKIVNRNLLKLVENGLSDRIFIRTIITKSNVNRLGEILEQVNTLYHDVCGIIAEPVMGMSNFESINDYVKFSDDFAVNFSRTRIKAIEMGVNFTTMILRNIDFSINYGCEGDFCVTPDGMISICHRLASPIGGESQLTDNYGFVSSSEVNVDSNRYKIMLGEGVDSRKTCNGCFAKYNCGGGCIARNLSETDESKEIYCGLVRKLLKDELLRRYINLQE